MMKNNVILKKLFLSDSNLCKYFLLQTAAGCRAAPTSFPGCPCSQEQAGACSGGAGVGACLFIPALE